MPGPLIIDLADHDGPHWLRKPLKPPKPPKGKKGWAAQVVKEWDESLHPRIADGTFTESGGGTATQEHPSHAIIDGGETAYTTVTPAGFIAARETDPNWRVKGGFLSPLHPDDLTGHTLLTSHGGKVGVAIDPQGDVQNVFNNGAGKGAGAAAVLEAIARGGRTLDCYDGYLPGLYSQLGFVETGRMRFDPAHATPQWDLKKNNSPDVVFMAYQAPGETAAARLARAKEKEQWHDRIKATRYYTDWDRAKADSRRAVHPDDA